MQLTIDIPGATDAQVHAALAEHYGGAPAGVDAAAWLAAMLTNEFIGRVNTAGLRHAEAQAKATYDAAVSAALAAPALAGVPVPQPPVEVDQPVVVLVGDEAAAT